MASAATMPAKMPATTLIKIFSNPRNITSNTLDLPCYTEVPTDIPLAHTLGKWQTIPVFAGLLGRVVPGNFGFFYNVLHLYGLCKLITGGHEESARILGGLASLGLSIEACRPSLEQMMDGAERAVANLVPAEAATVHVCFPTSTSALGTHTTVQSIARKITQTLALTLPVGSGLAMTSMGDQGLRGMPLIGTEDDIAANFRTILDVGTFWTNLINYIGQSLSLVNYWAPDQKTTSEINTQLCLILIRHIYTTQFKALSDAVKHRASDEINPEIEEARQYLIFLERRALYLPTDHPLGHLHNLADTIQQCITNVSGVEARVLSSTVTETPSRNAITEGTMTVYPDLQMHGLLSFVLVPLIAAGAQFSYYTSGIAAEQKIAHLFTGIAASNATAAAIPHSLIAALNLTAPATTTALSTTARAGASTFSVLSMIPLWAMNVNLLLELGNALYTYWFSKQQMAVTFGEGGKALTENPISRSVLKRQSYLAVLGALSGVFYTFADTTGMSWPLFALFNFCNLVGLLGTKAAPGIARMFRNTKPKQPELQLVEMLLQRYKVVYAIALDFQKKLHKKFPGQFYTCHSLEQGRICSTQLRNNGSTITSKLYEATQTIQSTVFLCPEFCWARQDTDILAVLPEVIKDLEKFNYYSREMLNAGAAAGAVARAEWRDRLITLPRRPGSDSTDVTVPATHVNSFSDNPEPPYQAPVFREPNLYTSLAEAVTMVEQADYWIAAGRGKYEQEHVNHLSLQDGMTGAIYKEYARIYLAYRAVYRDVQKLKGTLTKVGCALRLDTLEDFLVYKPEAPGPQPTDTNQTPLLRAQDQEKVTWENLTPENLELLNRALITATQIQAVLKAASIFVGAVNVWFQSCRPSSWQTGWASCQTLLKNDLSINSDNYSTLMDCFEKRAIWFKQKTHTLGTHSFDAGIILTGELDIATLQKKLQTACQLQKLHDRHQAALAKAEKFGVVVLDQINVDALDNLVTAVTRNNWQKPEEWSPFERLLKTLEQNVAEADTSAACCSRAKRVPMWMRWSTPARTGTTTTTALTS
jgi:hypothetical protein